MAHAAADRIGPVTAYRGNLPPGDLMDFPYTGLDRLGVPAYSTAL